MKFWRELYWKKQIDSQKKNTVERILKEDLSGVMTTVTRRSLLPGMKKRVLYVKMLSELNEIDVNKTTGLTGISGRMWMALVRVVGLNEVAKWFN